MVSFSPTVSIREYERIIDVNATDTFLGLALGWAYKESSRPTLKRRRNQTSILPPTEFGNASLHWGERLEILRSYGFPEKQLDSFWTASRRKAVSLDEQEEQRRNEQVSVYLASMLGVGKKASKTKENKKKETNKRSRGWISIRKHRASRSENKDASESIDSSSLHRSPRLSKQRRRTSPPAQ